MEWKFLFVMIAWCSVAGVTARNCLLNYQNPGVCRLQCDPNAEYYVQNEECAQDAPYCCLPRNDAAPNPPFPIYIYMPPGGEPIPASLPPGFIYMNRPPPAVAGVPSPLTPAAAPPQQVEASGDEASGNDQEPPQPQAQESAEPPAAQPADEQEAEPPAAQPAGDQEAEPPAAQPAGDQEAEPPAAQPADQPQPSQPEAPQPPVVQTGGEGNTTQGAPPQAGQGPPQEAGGQPAAQEAQEEPPPTSKAKAKGAKHKKSSDKAKELAKKMKKGKKSKKSKKAKKEKVAKKASKKSRKD